MTTSAKRCASAGSKTDHLVPTRLDPDYMKNFADNAAPVVDGVSTRGFNIRGITVLGSVALLPRGLLHWKVGGAGEQHINSFLKMLVRCLSKRTSLQRA